MAEADAIEKARRLYISKADLMKHGRGTELKDTLKDAMHDSKLRSPRRKMGEHA